MDLAVTQPLWVGGRLQLALELEKRSMFAEAAEVRGDMVGILHLGEIISPRPPRQWDNYKAVMLWACSHKEIFFSQARKMSFLWRECTLMVLDRNKKRNLTQPEGKRAFV